MNKRKFTFGYTCPTTVEVTNRQQCVEYRILSIHPCDEQEIRSGVGNTYQRAYAPYYDGSWYHRKVAIDRLTDEIKETKEKLADLEFALKVTKKRNWKEVN